MEPSKVFFAVWLAGIVVAMVARVVGEVRRVKR